MPMPWQLHIHLSLYVHTVKEQAYHRASFSCLFRLIDLLTLSPHDG